MRLAISCVLLFRYVMLCRDRGRDMYRVDKVGMNPGEINSQKADFNLPAQ